MTKITRSLTTILLIFLIVFVYLVLFLEITNNQKIAWRIKIANFNVGGQAPFSAQEILEEKWNDFANQEILLIYQDKTWPIKLTHLGFEMNSQLTIDQARQIGHQVNFLASLKEQLVALTGYYNLDPVYQIDNQKFQEKTSQIFADIEKPAQNATLAFNEEINDFSLVHSTEGTTIEREKLLNDLSQRARSFSAQPINLSLIFDYPTVENNEVDLALKTAQNIIFGQPYYLTHEDDTWDINKKTVLDWIKFEPVEEEDSDNKILGASLDKEKIRKHLKRIALTIDRPYTNARLKIEGGRAIEFRTAKQGFEVKFEQTFNQLVKSITSNSSIRTTKIIADVSHPKIQLSETNDLGINELVGQGVSNFAGSPANRKHNIKTGTSKFNTSVLAPGEEFSFNNVLGGSGPEQGFLPELVIKDNKTIPEYGGGLCQVSTTLFRAAINSGLEIVERKAHAFPVVYYAPHGFDATVYEPKPDFRFLNDTPGYLLIEGIVEGNQLTFNFYSTKVANQEIFIKGPYILESNEDGSMKTVLTQEVYEDGKLFYRKSFYSNYDSPDDYIDEEEEENSE